LDKEWRLVSSLKYPAASVDVRMMLSIEHGGENDQKR
jgi:hypothetical protein